MTFPKIDRASVPELTTDQMIEVDRAMIEDYGIQLIQMMENAGRALALLARERFLGGNANGKTVTVLAGTGGNGGGAMVAARRLAARGAKVCVYTTKPAEHFAGVPAHQLKISMSMNIPVASTVPDGRPGDVVLNGIIGYSLDGVPRERAADLIRWADGVAAPILSLDAPSGLDTTSGTAFDPGIEALCFYICHRSTAGLVLD